MISKKKYRIYSNESPGEGGGGGGVVRILPEAEREVGAYQSSFLMSIYIVYHGRGFSIQIRGMGV